MHNTIDLDEIEAYTKKLNEITESAKALSARISSRFEKFSIDSPEITKSKEDLAEKNNAFSNRCVNVVNSLTTEITNARKSIQSSEQETIQQLAK